MGFEFSQFGEGLHAVSSTTATTVSNGQYLIYNGVGASVTITLPAPVAQGLVAITNNDSHNITVSCSSGTFVGNGIGGNPTSLTLVTGGTFMACSEGTVWNVVVGVNCLINGNATIGGTLGVTGNGTIGGTLNVTGGGGFGGNFTVGGTLGVTGTSTLAALNATAANLSSLGVSGTSTLGTTNTGTFSASNIKYGSSSITISSGNASGTTTVTHGLGGTPNVVLLTLSETTNVLAIDYPIRIFQGSNTNPTPSSTTFDVMISMGSGNNAASGNYPFYWLAAI